MLAFILDYPEEWRLLRGCVYAPAVVILVSWFLIRWKPQWVFTAVALATIAAVPPLFIVDALTRNWVELLRRIYDEPQIRAVWFAVTFPYVMIALFYSSARKRPINRVAGGD